MPRKVSLIKSLDWFTIAIYVVMVAFGWITIYAACYDYENPEIFNFQARHGAQLIWIGMAGAIALSVLLIDSKLYNNLAYLIYFLIILLLIATIFLSPDIKGSRSWLKIGSISVQPAEFAKYATALCLAKFMSSYQFSLMKPRNIAIIATIIGLPFLIIIAQQETGSALVFASFLFVLFREGMNGIFLLLAFLLALFFVLFLRYNNLPTPDNIPSEESWGLVIVFILAVITVALMIKFYLNDRSVIRKFLLINMGIYAISSLLHYFEITFLSYTVTAYISIIFSIIYLIFWGFYKKKKQYFLFTLFIVGTIGLCVGADYFFNNVLEPHQQIRIKVVLGIEDDPQGAGYNVRQSKISIGSGGFMGKGFLNGTQTKLNYVPEQDTDFIFCTIGEEEGFVGTSVVIILYMALLIRILILAERQRSSFSRIYGYSVAGIIFFHFTVNIGMVIGLAPVIGIPLVFFSYGGSSLWSFTLLLFTFIRLDANRMEVLQQ